MNKIFIRIVNMCIIVAVALVFSAFSVVADDVNKGTLTVKMSDSVKNITLQNADVSIYKVADFVNFQNHEFMPQEKFVSSVSNLDFSSLDKACTSENSKTISDFIKKQGIKADMTIRSDSSGQAVFEALDFGIYFVDVTNSGDYTVESFLTEVPLSENGVFTTEVNASPKFAKVETPQKTPSSDKKGGPIPQTGQLRWPVPVMFILGITLVVLGYADYSNKKKKALNNETK